jgi:hypothetical protein
MSLTTASASAAGPALKVVGPHVGLTPLEGS